MKYNSQIIFYFNKSVSITISDTFNFKYTYVNLIKKEMIYT